MNYKTKNKPIRSGHIVIAVVLIVISCIISIYSDRNAEPSAAASAPLSVHYIDVGQGDCAYIKLPDGKNMLIDAGENDAGARVAEYIRDLGVRKLDYVVATHPHADHIGGMDDVINSFDVGSVYMPEAPANTESFKSVLDAIERKGVKVHKAKNGVYICKSDKLTVKILSPVSDSYEEGNDYSAVVRIVYGKRAFLFTGDAEKTVERELMSMGEELRADVLKVGHHGSVTSTGAAFLKAVAPSAAVISSGKGNSYDHPHDKIVKRLKKAGVRIFRTDESGTIVIGCDGENIIY